MTAPVDARQPGDAPDADRWYCGPASDRRAYVVDDIQGIQGGQGRVVRAERRTFAGDTVGYAGPVSLKLTTERRPERIALLRDRWAQLAMVDHPNLAGAVEVFEGPGLFRTTCPPDTDDVLYVAATWVDGQSLRCVAPLDPLAVGVVVRDVGAGLANLHARGLVHRDVHPGNVIVGDGGRATLIDFGSTRPDDGTDTATVAGALGFIPPETLHDAGGASADRWGLGMITAFALLGHPQGAMSRGELEAELIRVLDGCGDRRRAVRLVSAMLETDPARRPGDGVRWASEVAAALGGRRSRRARRALVLSCAVALVGLAAAGATATGALDVADTGEGTAAAGEGATTTTDCAPVTAGGGASPDLIAAVDRLAPGACSAGEPQRFVDAEVQPLADTAGMPDGVVLLTPSGTAVRLNQTMWASYREIAGKTSPENAVLLGGYPVAVELAHDPDAVVIRLESGGLIVGRRDDTQMFWLPTHVLDLFEARGGLTGDLGFPTTNPYFVGGHLRLDFEHGYMEAEVTDLGALLMGAEVDTAVTVADPAAPLRDQAIRDRIVRQTSGTAWWVDEAGERHWIPDGGTWECLGGDASVAVDGLSGWAVATLPLGPPAACP